MSACYNGQWLPKITKLAFPMTGGVLYDVFDQRIVVRQDFQVRQAFQPDAKRDAVRLESLTYSVDLTTYPGKLLAVAPEELAAPRVDGAVREGTLHYRASVVGASGKVVAARVPIRVRLLATGRVIEEFYRGTGPDGAFAGSLPLPINDKAYALEITELLGGKAARLDAAIGPPAEPSFAERNEVEIQRSTQIAALLEDARKSGLTLVTANAKILATEQVKVLSDALKLHGVGLRIAAETPKEATPGTYLAVGCLQGVGDMLGPMLRSAREQNLLDFPLTESVVPGPGRGLVSAVYAARGWKENMIALVGGDTAGLAKTIKSFVEWASVGQATPDTPTANVRHSLTYTLAGKPADAPGVPKLSEMTGPRLAGLTVAPDGKHLLLTAEGFLKNLALVRDEGTLGRVVTACRVAQSHRAPLSPYVSADARLIGASGRVTADMGDAFYLIDAANGTRRAFAGFGDVPPQTHAFAATSSGDTVVTGGVYGIVCWKKDAAAPAGWKEAWAVDYWREFDKLDWPVANDKERVPQFNAYIPGGAEYVLVVFNEFSQNGWVTPENFCRGYVAALDLADGKQRWRFDVPVPNTQVWPALVMTPGGKRLLLKVQLGGWNRETFRYFILDSQQGRSIGVWDSIATPATIALCSATGRIAVAYGSGREHGEAQARLLEVRAADGKLLYNIVRDSLPVSLAFSADGKRLFVADDSGNLTCLDDNGARLWQTTPGCALGLASGPEQAAASRLYAAGRDGRLRAYDVEGKLLWSLDMTPAMKDDHPTELLVQAGRFEPAEIHRAVRPSTCSAKVPDGPNLLAGCKPGQQEVKNAEGKVTGHIAVATNGKASLSVGGTSGWMSQGRVEIKPEVLANGRTDDGDTPWLHPHEMFWDGCAGRQVYATIEFAQPTDVRAVTVYEAPKFEASWPTQGLIQVWDEKLKQWSTVKMGLFLHGPVTTYEVNLKGVTKLRYVPWSNYFRNFHTSEIEVR
jgi:outer membrane protein assembly factor BamB